MTTPDAFRDAEYVADISEVSENSHRYSRDVASSDDRRAGIVHLDLGRKAQRVMKIAYIDRLLRDLDIVTYCELSALYYMEFVSLPASTDI
jgi:hypothetical protein